MSQEVSQMAFPFPLDQAKLSEFLTFWIAIEEEQDRLLEEARLLKEKYMEDFPMRAILVAVKRVRALHKLENHPKEGMKREHLVRLEALVELHLVGMRAEVDMTTGEVTG